MHVRYEHRKVSPRIALISSALFESKQQQQ